MATTKQGRQLFGGKSAPQRKSCYAMCLNTK